MIGIRSFHQRIDDKVLFTFAAHVIEEFTTDVTYCVRAQGICSDVDEGTSLSGHLCQVDTSLLWTPLY
jgi:hypothetical protein